MNWREMLPKFHPLHKEPEPEWPPQLYSLCESVTAGPTSRWHIRPLTRRGKLFGGGADTPALCGRKVSWDLKPDPPKVITPNLKHICPTCLAIYKEKL